METLFLLMKKTRATKFKVRMFYHLQNLFWGVFVRGVFGLGAFVRGGFVGGYMSGRGVCPVTRGHQLDPRCPAATLPETDKNKVTKILFTGGWTF